MRGIRLVHLGVAAALTAAALTSVAIVRTAGAAGPGASSFVPIVPCRLADTRSGPDHVGTRATAIGAGEVVPFAVWGSNGSCSIPSGATGIATNVTAVNPTASSYLTFYPADAAARPQASNLNWTSTSSPTPNQVTVALSATGSINAYNLAGTIDVIIDIVGYYESTSAGPVGPAGQRGLSAWDTIPSGVTVIGEYMYNTHGPNTSVYDTFSVSLPGIAPVALTSGNINVKNGADNDPTCTGTVAAPTAPAGKVCIYRNIPFGIDASTIKGDAGNLPTRAFWVNFRSSGIDNDDEVLSITWAYTAP